MQLHENHQNSIARFLLIHNQLLNKLNKQTHITNHLQKEKHRQKDISTLMSPKLIKLLTFHLLKHIKKHCQWANRMSLLHYRRFRLQKIREELRREVIFKSG